MPSDGSGPDECPLCGAMTDAESEVPAHIRHRCPDARAIRTAMGLPPEGHSGVVPDCRSVIVDD